MLCTECNRPIRPVVAIDIDGTIGDYHGHFLRFASQYMDHDFGMHYTGAQEMHDYMGLPLEVYRQIKLAYRQGGGKRMMTPISGAGQLMDKVYRSGAEIWLTTTRPYNRFDSTDPDTRFWLERYKIPYDHLLYDDEKYPILAAHVGAERVAAVLDDLPVMLYEAEKVFKPGTAILVRGRWNTDLRWGGPTAESLYQASKMIVQRVEEWYDAV
jgi:hypothetical protein